MTNDAIEGEEYCVDHQGDTSHYDKKNCTVCRLERQNAELVEALKAADDAICEVNCILLEEDCTEVDNEGAPVTEVGKQLENLSENALTNIREALKAAGRNDEQQ